MALVWWKAAIYCHNDGYPNYMYPMLSDWYGTEERARALVSFGDASYIEKRLIPTADSKHSFDHPEEDVCVFYHRDRDELWKDNAPLVCCRDQLFNMMYYLYIFEDGAWHVYVNKKEVKDYADLDSL